MADKIIRGYWDCPQCGMKGIDGLLDTCPGCGSGKDKNVRYYMKEVEEVSDEELATAGISKDENDGKHTEWICAYCGFLNNYADETCVRCGAAKEEKQQDYGGDTQEVKYEKDKHGNLKETGKKEEIPKETYQKKPTVEEISPQKKSGSPLRFLLPVALLALLAFLLWPHTYSQAISGFKWERNVTVEELQTFSESGWDLPYGARQTDSKVEFYGYRQVLDHYETVYETRYRDVLDHYDTSYEYRDNGNGTFTQHEVRTPVYRSEPYQEAVRSPVYRNEPVYQTKYYYDIDRWVTLNDYPTSGNDHEPYWSDAYTLSSRQRDEDRTESYYTIYTDTTQPDQEPETRKVSYEEWKDQKIGDGVYVKRCRLGIEYSRTSTGE